MAYKLAKTGVQANVQIREYICDAVDDIATLPDSDPFGSKVFVIETSETYVKSSDGEYVKTTSGGGGITPVGVINITENGDHDVTEKATARVNVPVPPGYVIPTGSVDIMQNGQGIDVAGKATANVNVPQGVFPSGTKLITQNVTGEDVTNYAAVDVAVPGPTGDIKLSAVGQHNVASYATATVSDFVREEGAPNLEPLRLPGRELAHNSGYNVIFCSFKINRQTDALAKFELVDPSSVKDIVINNDGSYTVLNDIQLVGGKFNLNIFSAGWHVIRIELPLNATACNFYTSNGCFDLAELFYETYIHAEKIATIVKGVHVVYIDNKPSGSVIFRFFNLYCIEFDNCDYSSVTSLDNAFANDMSLKSIDLHDFDFSSVTTAKAIFSGCFGLRKLNISGVDFTKVSTLSAALNGIRGGCIDMHGIKTRDLTNLTNIGSYFYGVEYIDMRFDFCGADFSISQCRCPTLMFDSDCQCGSFFLGSESNGIREIVGFPHCNDNVTLSSANSISADTLVFIVNQLNPVQSTKTLALGATNLAKLTADQIAIAQDKGWTVT